jgi:hypothetical protein
MPPDILITTTHAKRGGGSVSKAANESSDGRVFRHPAARENRALLAEYDGTADERTHFLDERIRARCGVA